MKTSFLLAASTIALLCTTTPNATAAPTARVKDIAFAHLNDRSAHYLTTQSRSFDSMFLAEMPPIDHIQHVSQTIPTATKLVPVPVNPIDALQDFSGTLDRFFAQAPPQPEPFKPLSFFEIPRLDSGLTVGLLSF